MASTPGAVFTCRLRPELYPAYRREYLRQQITVAALWLVPLPIILWFLSNDPVRHPSPDAAYIAARLLTVVIFAAPLVAIMAFLIYRAMKKAQVAYAACTFVVTPDTVVRTDAGGKQTNFDLRQVIKTQRVQKKGLMLQTGKPAIFLFIPEQLENYEEVARFLENDRVQSPLLARMPLLYRQSITNAAFAVCWLVALLAPVRWLAMSGAVLSASFCVFAVWHPSRNPNCSASAKRSSWLLMILVLIMIWHMSSWQR